MRQAIQAQRALLQPVEAAAFAVLIDRLFAFARTFGLANPDTTAATGFYRQALKDIPADLVAKAVERVCRGWKWGHKIPLPADLYGAVSDELTRRKKELAQLEQALLRLPRPEAEKERVGAGQIRALRLHLEHFANAHRMPGVSARPPQART